MFKVGDRVRIRPGTYASLSAFNGVIGTIVEIKDGMFYVETNVQQKLFRDGVIPTSEYNLELYETGIDRARRVIKCSK